MNLVRHNRWVSLRNRVKPDTRSDLWCVAGWRCLLGVCSNGGSLAQSLFSRLTHQEETQDVWECEVADELVVVIKFRPVKPGNSVEEKTGMTTG